MFIVLPRLLIIVCSSDVHYHYLAAAVVIVLVRPGHEYLCSYNLASIKAVEDKRVDRPVARDKPFKMSSEVLGVLTGKNIAKKILPYKFYGRISQSVPRTRTRIKNRSVVS